MKNYFFQKGVSLYISCLIMMLLLGLSLGLSIILVSQLKIIRDMSKSVVAFYAADSGIERGLKENPSPPWEFSGLLGDASYYVKAFSPGKEDCPSSPGITYCINSVGIYKGTRRAIQIAR